MFNYSWKMVKKISLNFIRRKYLKLKVKDNKTSQNCTRGQNSPREQNCTIIKNKKTSENCLKKNVYT